MWPKYDQVSLTLNAWAACPLMMGIQALLWKIAAVSYEAVWEDRSTSIHIWIVAGAFSGLKDGRIGQITPFPPGMRTSPTNSFETLFKGSKKWVITKPAGRTDEFALALVTDQIHQKIAKVHLLFCSSRYKFKVGITKSTGLFIFLWFL